jgi:hypothetical protein
VETRVLDTLNKLRISVRDRNLFDGSILSEQIQRAPIAQITQHEADHSIDRCCVLKRFGENGTNFLEEFTVGCLTDFNGLLFGDVDVVKSNRTDVSVIQLVEQDRFENASRTIFVKRSQLSLYADVWVIETSLKLHTEVRQIIGMNIVKKGLAISIVEGMAQ